MTTEERLDKLEKEHAASKRLIRRLLAGAGVVLGMFVLFLAFHSITDVAQGQSVKNILTRIEKFQKLQGEEHDPSKWNIIRANQFILEDEQGLQRATLILTKYGPGLYFYDMNGISCMELCSKDGEPYDVYRRGERK